MPYQILAVNSCYYYYYSYKTGKASISFFTLEKL